MPDLQTSNASNSGLRQGLRQGIENVQMLGPVGKIALAIVQSITLHF
jgi:hypothetical protein